MTKNNLNPNIIEEGLGALAIAGTILSSPVSRSWYRKWGATPEEVRMALPGDDLLPNPRLVSNRAISIHQPAAEIWPWIVQLGQGRGGFYSYQKLENLAGCQIHNADQIIPEYQAIQVGDQVRLGPEGYPAFEVAAVDPGVALILRGDTPNPEAKPTIWIWIFYLHPVDENTTRLILRTRLDYPASLGNTIAWRVFTDPLSFNMERQMLKGIKVRAEEIPVNQKFS